MDSIPELGKSPGVGNSNQLQYSCLKNSIDRGTWWAAVYGVAKSLTWLSDRVCMHSLKGSLHVQTTLTSGELWFLKSEYVHKLSGILLRVVSSPHRLIQSFFFLISAWTHRYLFYNSGYNSTLLCFVVEIVLSLSTGSSFSWFLCPSDIVSSLYFFLFNNSSFSGPEDSPRNVDPPFLGNTISHNLYSKYVHCYWDIFTSRPFQLTRVATIWVYINTLKANI